MKGDMQPVQPEVVTVGETMALFSSEVTGSLMRGALLRLSLGGAECNVAIGLSRLGVSAAWVGRLGQDLFGNMIEREVRAEGVQVFAPRDEGRPTGLMVKARRTEQFANVSYYRRGSAGSCLAPEDIPVDIVRRSRLLHVSGITPALSPSAAKAVDHAISIAQEAGVAVSFDLNYRAALWTPEEASLTYRRLVPQADVVFASEDEAAIVVGNQPVEALAASLAALGPHEVVIKRGARGALAHVAGTNFVAPAVPIAAVDTVGAGDAFVAGYVAGRIQAGDVARRLYLGVRAGALACLTVGDWEGLPSSSEINLFDLTEPVAR